MSSNGKVHGYECMKKEVSITDFFQMDGGKAYDASVLMDNIEDCRTPNITLTFPCSDRKNPQECLME